MSLKEDALAAGVHIECWETSGKGGCEPCRDIIFGLMDDRYENVPPDELRSTIAADILRGAL